MGVADSASRAAVLIALVSANLSVAGILGVAGGRGLSGRQGLVYAGLAVAAGSMLTASVWAPQVSRLFQFTALGPNLAFAAVALGIVVGLTVGLAALLIEDRVRVAPRP
jgi:hypothetical protein